MNDSGPGNVDNASHLLEIPQCISERSLSQGRPYLDDLGPSEGDYASHLHGVPAGALAHDIAVEGVQDAFVRQLQAVVQNDHVCCCLHLQHRPRSLQTFLI